MKVRAIAVLLAVCSHLTIVGAAEPSAPLADLLPAGTLVYAGWAGRSLTFDGSMFGQLLNDPDIAKIVQAVGQATQRDIRQDDEKAAFGRVWSMADIAWQHPVALALIDLRKGDHGPDPTGVLLIDLDTEREAFAKQLDGLLELIKEELPLTEATIGNVTYRVHRPDKGPEVSIGYMGNTLFVGIGAGAPKALVEHPLTGKLSADKKFTECLQAVAEGKVQMAYFLDITALVGKVEQFAPSLAGTDAKNSPKTPAQKVRELTATMGLDKVSVVAGATWVADRGLASRTRVFTPAPHRGLLMPLAGPEITDADLAGVPDDADFVLAARLSPQAAWEELRRATKDASPDVDREFAEGVGELEENLSISLGRDLLSQLGDCWVLSSAPSRGGFLAGTMLTVDVKDSVKLAETLQKIEAGLLPPPAPADDDKPSPRTRPDQPRVETLKFARANIRYLALPSRREPMPVAPAWSVHKNRLMLAGYPQVIQSALTRNGAAKPLTQTADFRSARGRIAGKPSMLFYCNGPKMARQVYHWAMVGWTTAANALAGEGVMDARASWLPPLATIEQYLRPSIAAICPDADGITFESYGSLPNATPMAGLLLNPLVFSISVPAAQAAREKAQVVRDQNELKMISMAVSMYQLDHGKLPPSLLDPKMRAYLAPNDRLQAALAKGQYIYLGSQLKGTHHKNSSGTVMVYRHAKDDPFILTAFLDGQVRPVAREKFLQLLAAQGIKP